MTKLLLFFYRLVINNNNSHVQLKPLLCVTVLCLFLYITSYDIECFFFIAAPDMTFVTRFSFYQIFSLVMHLVHFTRWTSCIDKYRIWPCIYCIYCKYFYNTCDTYDFLSLSVIFIIIFHVVDRVFVSVCCACLCVLLCLYVLLCKKKARV